MNSLSDTWRMVLLTLLVVPVILGSIFYLDEPLAVLVMQLLKSVHTLHRASAHIPDILLILVCTSSAAMWFAYFLLNRQGCSGRRLQFLLMAATAVPAAYMFKALLQFSFGRTNTRLWLSGAMPMEFSWFHGNGIGCFPSGHMTVFTAFFAAVCHYYPEYRSQAVGLLLLLAAALIATDYHFLGDVIAGAYLGLLVVYLLGHCLAEAGRGEGGCRRDIHS